MAELSRAQRFLRFSVDLVRHCSRELRENDAAQMAAALTYRTIFGLVPLLMVSMLAFRLFGDMETAGAPPAVRGVRVLQLPGGPEPPRGHGLQEALDERLLDIMKSVGELSFEAIGAVGALLLIWAALGLLISLENAANRIYRAPRGRGWPTRIGDLLDGAHARADPAAGRALRRGVLAGPGGGAAGRGAALRAARRVRLARSAASSRSRCSTS